MDQCMQSESSRSSISGVVVQLGIIQSNREDGVQKDTGSVAPAPRFTRGRLWLLAASSIAALALSIASLAQDDSEWLVADGDGRTERVGWRKACVEQFKIDGRAKVILPCQPDNGAESIDVAINDVAREMGWSILVISILAFAIPLMVLPCSCCVFSTNKRIFHCRGFIIAVLWATAGTALFASALLFRQEVNSKLKSNVETRFTVTCMSLEQQEVTVCQDVPLFDQCTAECRFAGSHDAACSGFLNCILYERDSACDLDGVGCEMEMGWALKASLASSALLFVTSLLLASGALTSTHP